MFLGIRKGSEQAIQNILAINFFIKRNIQKIEFNLVFTKNNICCVGIVNHDIAYHAIFTKIFAF